MLTYKTVWSVDRFYFLYTIVYNLLQCIFFAYVAGIYRKWPVGLTDRGFAAVYGLRGDCFLPFG